MNNKTQTLIENGYSEYVDLITSENMEAMSKDMDKVSIKRTVVSSDGCEIELFLTMAQAYIIDNTSNMNLMDMISLSSYAVDVTNNKLIKSKYQSNTDSMEFNISISPAVTEQVFKIAY